MAPAGRDVVDMVSFLADSEHKRSDVGSTSSARCGTVPQHTTTSNTRCGSVYCRTSPHTTQLSLPTHACSAVTTNTLMPFHTQYTVRCRNILNQFCPATILSHTHTVTCRQTSFHGSAQSTHFWVAFHIHTHTHAHTCSHTHMLTHPRTQTHPTCLLYTSPSPRDS